MFCPLLLKLKSGQQNSLHSVHPVTSSSYCPTWNDANPLAEDSTLTTKRAKYLHQSCGHQAQGLPADLFPWRRTFAFPMHLSLLCDTHACMHTHTYTGMHTTTTTKIYYVSLMQSAVLGAMRKTTMERGRRCGLSLQGPWHP